ncbi:hypothetical protein VNO77_31565 [Canavalia gladiata]|uniref:Uncharacterized protein n=1 Tax=Canavalia gladiata TaxID=3824 RepID=A0AAN9KSJ2_CANGL
MEERKDDIGLGIATYYKVVEKAWCSTHVAGWVAYRIHSKLKVVKQKIKVLNRDIFGNIDSQISQVTKDIQNLELDIKEMGAKENMCHVCRGKLSELVETLQ